MFRGRFIIFSGYTTFLLLFLYLVNCSAKKNHNHHCDNPSSCGSIVNISYPFRLKGDPDRCGDPNYELDCENNNTLVFHSYRGKYKVQAINYNNSTIRVVDGGVQKSNCSSLPLYYFTYPYSDFRYTGDSYPFIMANDTEPITFVKCENQVRHPRYIDTASCVNINNGTAPNSTKKHYSYVILGYITPSDLVNSCTIDLMAVISASDQEDQTSISFTDIHSKLADGFELSWHHIFCEECNDRGYCQLDSDYNVINCEYGYSVYLLFSLTWGVQDSGLDEVGDSVPLAILLNLAMLLVTYAGAHVAVKCVCCGPCVFTFLIYKWRRRHLSMFDTVEDFLRSHNNLMPIRYSFPHIKKMTNGFKEKLGEGGYGSVYKGKLRSGRAVAIKILGQSKANGQEFINEVATIGRIHHTNVAQLIGFCAERSKRALVYEFMPNGSLEKYIFPQEEENLLLSYEKMYKISLGVARGIEYLHQGCDMQILHFDIKPHNILLDENFNPKVSDFGLAKLYPTDNSIVPLTGARGTMGYMAPELFYKNIGGVSYKADVYSFGMLLMEMVGRRKNLNPFAEHSSQIYFPSWVYDQFNEREDIKLGGATEEESKIARKMVIVALWCIQLKPSDRPSMKKVVEMLEGNVEVLQMPPKPLLSPQEMRV